ncbi:hypothetical protein V8E54_004915 [Elaphomyces granulatus]
MPQTAAADSRGASHYAILIGINGTRLTGCVHDVEEITKVLNQTVKDVCIHSLTSTWSPNSLQPTEPKENWPIFDNISSCLLQVTQQAQQGDYVYIHYSGHSTVVPPSKPHSNLDMGDLALVVLEGPTASENRYFHGTELAERLKKMVDKGIGVTMVLDCCSSGSTLRGDEAIRYLPYDPKIDEKYPPMISFAQPPPAAVGQPSSLRGRRRASIVPNWLANPEGYAILTSSDATEKAYDVKFEDSPPHGTLTYFLLETFDMLGGVGGSMQQLFECISVKIQDHRRLHTKKKQHPVLLGNKRQLFFGCARLDCFGDTPVIPVTRIKGTQDQLQLHAGSAHGIFEDDRFALHPLGRETLPVTAKAVNIRGITSDLKIVEGEGDAVETGWLATATTRISLQQFPVLIKASDAHRAEWREALQQRLSLAEFNEEENVSPSCGGWSFMIVQVSETAYEIQDEFKQTITTLTGMEDSERMKLQLLDQLQHLASFKLVRGLTNKDADQSFFSVVLSKKDGEMESNPGCLSTKNIFDTCFHTECVTTMTSEGYLRVQNKHESSLFVYVFAMSCSDWEIEDMMKASRGVIPPKGSRHGLEVEATGAFKMKIGFWLDEGQESCEEIVKVFITTQPTSFTTLAMPKLGLRGSYAKPVLSAKRGKSEDWVAVTFRVRVVREEFSNKKAL